MLRREDDPGLKPLWFWLDFRGLKAPAPSETAEATSFSATSKPTSEAVSFSATSKPIFYFELGLLVCVDSGCLGVAR